MMDPRTWEQTYLRLRDFFVEWFSNLHPLAQVAPFVLLFTGFLQWNSLWDPIDGSAPGLLPFLASTRSLWMPLIFLGFTTPLIRDEHVEFASGSALFLTLFWCGWIDSPWRGPLLGATFFMLATAVLFHWKHIRTSSRPLMIALAFCLFAALSNFFIPDLVHGHWISWAPLTYAVFAFSHLATAEGPDLSPSRALSPGHLLGALLLPTSRRTSVPQQTWSRGLLTVGTALGWLILSIEIYHQIVPLEAEPLIRLFSGVSSFFACSLFGVGLSRLYGVSTPDPLRRPWFAVSPFDFLQRCAVFEVAFARQSYSPIFAKAFRQPALAFILPAFTAAALWTARFPNSIVKIFVGVLLTLVLEIPFRWIPRQRGIWGLIRWVFTVSSLSIVWWSFLKDL